MFFVDTLSLYVNHDLSSLWQILTVAGAHEEVEGYIQPSIDPNGKSIYITLRADLWYHCDAYIH